MFERIQHGAQPITEFRIAGHYYAILLHVYVTLLCDL